MVKHFVSGASNGTHSTKRLNPIPNGTEPPRKKVKKLLTDDSSTSSDDNSSGGAPLDSGLLSRDFTVNEDFAQRFEHNKRREELHKLEAKYGKRPTDGKPRISASDVEDATDSSSDSEEEDDEGVLASGSLDDQFQATLKAIRARDPRVYDKSTTFYTQPEKDDEYERNVARSREKSMHLSDYHRKNILEGVISADESEILPTYTQEQSDMKAAIIREIHSGANETGQGGQAKSNRDGTEDEDNDFLVPKAPRSKEVVSRPRVAAQTIIPDVERAEEDPERFLSDFMSSRAWVPHAGSRFQPFESDDEEEEKRADDFEETYNLRFEDPEASNEKLVSHARDAAARYSVRREASTGRKKAREVERTRREMERQEREEEKARLRKLQIADAEEKLKRIKDAAGLRKEHLNIDDWSKFLEEGWDDARWEEGMRQSFGDRYYADNDIEDDNKETVGGKAKIKKPKWKDDIEIHDLIPNFEEHDSKQPKITLSDTESDDSVAMDPGSDDEHSANQNPASKASSRKRNLHEQNNRQKQARKERRQIEQLVDQSLDAEDKLAGMGKKHAGVFRYRETSPVAYGLTAQDILMASDSQLNQYAGLKKLAAFRDSTKKARDRKKLGKKARLRQWRKETFGYELLGPQTMDEIIASQGARGSERALEEAGNVKNNTRRKKRSKAKSRVADL
ncbi:MAG: hypothetical protein Q9225_003471 [Loekoesia sp. 1 TL-2023]